MLSRARGRTFDFVHSFQIFTWGIAKWLTTKVDDLCCGGTYRRTDPAINCAKLISVPLPSIQPLRLGRHASAFSHPDWVFELKWDGFRSLAYIANGRSRLVSRKQNTFKSFSGLNSVLEQLGIEDAILDGEIVALDDNGKPDFNSLLFRRAKRLFFYAFDCLWLNGHDLRWQSLIERKDVLRRLPKGGPDQVRYVEYFEGTQGTAFFEVCCAHDLEGIVAKRRDSAYLEADHEAAWLKIKNRHYSQAVDRHELFEGTTGVKASATASK